MEPLSSNPRLPVQYFGAFVSRCTQFSPRSPATRIHKHFTSTAYRWWWRENNLLCSRAETDSTSVGRPGIPFTFDSNLSPPVFETLVANNILQARSNKLVSDPPIWQAGTRAVLTPRMVVNLGLRLTAKAYIPPAFRRTENTAKAGRGSRRRRRVEFEKFPRPRDSFPATTTKAAIPHPFE